MENNDYSIRGEEEMLDFYQKLRKNIRKQLRKNSKENEKNTVWAKLVDQLIFLPDLFHLGIRLLFDKNMPTENKGALIAGLAYVISPIDLIPDAIPIAGWIDDLIVMTMAINKYLNNEDIEVEKAINKYWAGDKNLLEILQHILLIAESAAEFLPKKLFKIVKGIFRR